MTRNCPPDDVLQRLLADELTAAEEDVLESHVAGCEACQRRLDELTQLPQSVHGLPTDTGNGDAAPRPSGLLARLADSSKPVLRLARRSRAEGSKAKDSSARSFSSSTISASGRLLRRQIWIWPLLAAAVLGGIGWWVSWSVESAMRQQRINELTTVLNADVTALRQWMDNQLATAQLLAADEMLRPLVQELLDVADGTPAARSHLMQTGAQAAIRVRLAERLRSGKFTGFLLVSPAGTVVATEEDAPLGAQLSGYRRDFFAGVTNGQSAMSKPFLSPLLLADEQGQLQANQPCMYVAAPIRDEGGRAIAALGLRIRPGSEFTRILHVARSGETGETYAFDRGGVILSQSRFDEELKQIGLLVDRPGSRSILSVELRDPGVNMVAGERPTVRRSDQPLTRMARAAVRGIDGHDVDGYRDYRGVPVVGAWQWLDEYDFGVATEVDVDEAFAPAYILRRAFAVLMGLLIAAAGGIYVAMLLIARQRRQLRDANLAAQQFGQYTLVEEIGSGGMGTVYRARHALLRRPTAVKLLNPESMSDTAIARFEREVQLTSELTHPNTVAIYDYGRTPEGIFYYAMEYLDGVNLDDLVQRYGALPEARAVFILRQVCSSLAEAHAAGMVHRDIKPANIFLTCCGGQHDFVKLLDFGLAKSAGGRPEPSLTATNTVAGTPLYMSPESITNPDQVDARADVYAIGAVGYLMLTDSPVFAGSSSSEIYLMHVSTHPQPPSARTRQPISPELESLLLRCLAKSPADRPADAGELLRLLEACPATGIWTPADAANWWAERRQEHSAATRVSPMDTPRNSSDKVEFPSPESPATRRAK